MNDFLIITKYGRYIIQAEDIADAVDKVYDNHCGYHNVQAIVCINEDY